MSGKNQNTNLASEYYVLSVLYRMGANALLTLGNKKAVDIVVDKAGKTLTIDVKGLQSKNSSFPVDNWTKIEEDHFLVFVTFMDKMDDPECHPEVYIVPSNEMELKRDELDGQSLIYRNPKGNRKVVNTGRLRKLKHLYLNNWSYFFQ